MMKLEMATTLRPSAVEAALHDPTLNILLIDCRSFMDYNSCHIANAHNVHFPPIVKRRSGGTIPLANVIRCAKTRALLLNGQYDMVILYDERSSSLDSLPQDSVVFLVLKSLTDETNIHPLYLVEGGFLTFFTCYPRSCAGMSVVSDASSAGQQVTCPSSTNHHHLQLPAVSVSTTVTSACSQCSSAAPRDCTARDCPSLNGVSGARRDSAKMRRILLEQEDEPVQVLPWLYLGSVQHASRPEQLQELGVQALLNVSAVEYDDMPESFCYKTIPVDDSSSSDLFTWFPEAIDFIESVRLNNSKVLVHCQAGVSRSATVCLAYLMYHKRLGLEQAYDFLKSRRSVIAPNLNFMHQLVQFETQLAGRDDSNDGKLDADASGADVSVTVEAPTPPKKALTLTLTPGGPTTGGGPVSSGSTAGVGGSGAPAVGVPPAYGYMFSFDSPLSPLAPTASFATYSPLVSPS